MDDDLPPLEKDVLEKRQNLSERDFIQENRGPPPSAGPLPLWLWLTLVVFAAALVWGSMGWFQGFVDKKVSTEPFLDVTNRQFSLFLWQFPSFMKGHIKERAGYLPAFQSPTKEILDPAAAEQVVSAPPEVLFLYHTWSRLLSTDFIPRTIPPAEFEQFLQQVRIWQPEFWKEAPSDYVNLIKSKAFLKEEDLQTLPEKSLPITVRRAFQGWKNYFAEGAQINKIAPTIAEVNQFLEQHPAYARHFWRNIEEIESQEVAGKQYLSILMNPPPGQEQPFPIEQLAPFLKVALFNFAHSSKVF